MIRNLKALGLALVAMFAMSAVAASAASADLFHAEQAGTTLTVSSNASQVFTYEEGAEVVCTTVTGSGGAVSGGAEDDEVSFSPSYSGCSIPGVGSATVNFNGCSYLFTEPNGETKGAAHVECPAGKSILIQVYLGADEPGNELCHFNIGTQTDLAGSVKYENTGSGTTREVKLTPDISGIDATKTNDNIFGFLCGGATSTNGTYDGAVTVTGEKSGSHVGTWVE